MSVHGSHCCVVHGCKYGDKDCPVKLDIETQIYLCENCSDEGIENIEELIKLRDFFKNPKIEMLNVLDVLRELLCDSKWLSQKSINTIKKYYPNWRK